MEAWHTSEIFQRLGSAGTIIHYLSMWLWLPYSVNMCNIYIRTHTEYILYIHIHIVVPDSEG